MQDFIKAAIGQSLPQGPRKSQVMEQLDRLNQAINQLNETLGKFRTRLSDVTRPSTDEIEKATASADLVPVAHELFICANRINSLTELANDLLGRLEV